MLTLLETRASEHALMHRIKVHLSGESLSHAPNDVETTKRAWIGRRWLWSRTAAATAAWPGGDDAPTIIAAPAPGMCRAMFSECLRDS